jgi:hypothetical protein
MLKRLVIENWWSVPVPLSAICLLLSWLIGPGVIGNILAWLGIALGFSALIVFINALRFSTLTRHNLRVTNMVLNLVWAGLIVVLVATGRLTRLTQPPERAHYPGWYLGTATGDVADWLREDWQQANRDLYRVDVSAIEARFEKEFHNSLRIEVLDTDRAIFLLEDHEGRSWQFELLDVEDKDGHWVKPTVSE